jgi:poly-gamma-glutamate system protein
MAAGGMVAVEWFTVRGPAALLDEKVAAANLASKCFDVIRDERLSRGYPLDPVIDPTLSGVMGLAESPVTSISGHLQSKQASVNPNFAAAVVQMLHDGGVEEGDQVAVGYTGSLPALNVAVCAACETMGVRPIVVASATSSQFGANFPDLLWIDMERTLEQQGLIHFRSRAVSIGGYQDRGLQFSDEDLNLIRRAIERNELPMLRSVSFADSIDRRMAIYHDEAGGRPIKAYINVGGGTVSVGRRLGKQMYRPGLNLEPPPAATKIDSVMTRFAAAGVPVIHLVEVRQLARQHDLPTELAEAPVVGQGSLFGANHSSRLLAAGVLVAILIALRSIVLTDWSHRLVQRCRRWTGRSTTPGQPEPEWMV